jgi:hypothetical protein
LTGHSRDARSPHIDAVGFSHREDTPMSTITLPSNHVAMLSHPAEVPTLIIEAARTAPVNG